MLRNEQLLANLRHALALIKASAAGELENRIVCLANAQGALEAALKLVTGGAA